MGEADRAYWLPKRVEALRIEEKAPKNMLRAVLMERANRVQLNRSNKSVNASSKSKRAPLNNAS